LTRRVPEPQQLHGLLYFLAMISISPANLGSAQRHRHKVNGAKDAIIFHHHFC
jgi:hypothetical protein